MYPDNSRPTAAPECCCENTINLYKKTQPAREVREEEAGGEAGGLVSTTLALAIQALLCTMTNRLAGSKPIALGWLRQLWLLVHFPSIPADAQLPAVIPTR